MKERLLQKDPTWARDFNPRKLKPISNFKILSIVEKVEKTKVDNEIDRQRLEAELLRRNEPSVGNSPSRGLHK